MPSKLDIIKELMEKRRSGVKTEQPKRIYNIKIDRTPHAELQFTDPLLTLSHTVALPSVVDLRSKLPAVYDQGQLGSCTANALCAAFQYNVPKFMGSRLFLYYNERNLEGTRTTDSGAYIHDGVRSMTTMGLCSETEWPYDISKFAVKPSTQCYTDALKDCVVKSTNIRNDMNSMKNSLNSGFPFVVGFLVYSSFETTQVARTGIIPMPTKKDTLLGGHAVLVCGYNDTTQRWTVRNSWGSNWGDKGYFYLPYQYLLDSSLCSDLWNITATNVPGALHLQAPVTSSI